MKNQICYVPILKWKRGEENALKHLDESHKKFMTPLIELVMPYPKLFKDKEQKINKSEEEIFEELISDFRNKRISQIPDEIKMAWGSSPIYIDFSLLYTIPLRIESINGIIKKGLMLNLQLIPVLNLNDDEKIIKTICANLKEERCLCLRIVQSDLLSISNLNKKIDVFFKAYKLCENNIDLLVDLKDVNETFMEYQKLLSLSQEIKNIFNWRKLIFASGAFPKDMSNCAIDKLNYLPRLDFINWQNQTKNKKLKRIPIFADYTIRHPIYNEKAMSFSPTTIIKYTRETDWLVMKGEKQNFILYLANANLLSEEKSIFYGEDYSFGDKYIADKGRHYVKYMKDPKIKGTGTSETWITAGINHHMVCTINQVANLI
jgi:hypothetical protein